MRYEILHNLKIPKIGFGTWQIGGRRSPDPSSDELSLAALRSALELGYTHFDTAEGYADGHCEELVGQAVRTSGAPREALFITTKVSPDHLAYDDVLRCCEASLRRLGLDYVYLYLIHWPQVGMKLPEILPSQRAARWVCAGSKPRSGLIKMDEGISRTSKDPSGSNHSHHVNGAGRVKPVDKKLGIYSVLRRKSNHEPHEIHEQCVMCISWYLFFA